MGCLSSSKQNLQKLIKIRVLIFFSLIYLLTCLFIYKLIYSYLLYSISTKILSFFRTQGGGCIRFVFADRTYGREWFRRHYREIMGRLHANATLHMSRTQPLGFMRFVVALWQKSGFGLQERTNLTLGSRDRKTSRKTHDRSQTMGHVHMLGAVSPKSRMPQTRQCLERRRYEDMGYGTRPYYSGSSRTYKERHLRQMGRQRTYLFLVAGQDNQSLASRRREL